MGEKYFLIKGNKMQGMNGIFAQVKKMQEEMTKIQAELAHKTVEGSSGGGMVKVLCNGKQEIQKVSIEKDVVDPEDIEMLQDLVTAAVNDALSNSRKMMEKEMGALTGGLSGLPGLGGLNLPGF